MRELRDSSELVADPVALRLELRRHGYLFLPGLVPSNQVTLVAVDVTRVLMRHGFIDDEGARVTRRGRRALVDGRITAAAYADLQTQESLHRLVCHDTIRATISSLLGPAIVHPQRLIRTTMPARVGGPTLPAVHRDYPAWRIPDMMTVWLPLTPCPPQRGGLCVLEDSHGADLVHPQDDLSDPAWATAAYQPGDVLVIHCYTLHGALPNVTRTARLSVDSRWQRLRDPVPHWATLPDRADGWDPYTAEWSSTAWVEIPAAAHVVAEDDEWDPLTVLPPSVFMSEGE